MIVLIETKTIEEGARSWSDLEIRQLLTTHVTRLQQLNGYGLDQLVNFVVMEHDDVIDDLDAALGFSIMANHFDGCRYGDPGFSPSWEFIEEHINWYELVYVLSDDGFGVVVFISKQAPAELVKMLHQYSCQ